EQYGISIRQLMENAGYQIAAYIRQEHSQDQQIDIHVGKGHNGGDGLVAARRLAGWGFNVSISLITSNLGGIPADELATLQQLDIPISKSMHDGDIIVDGLIGYSLSGAPRPPFDTRIQEINDSSSHVVSIDVPSGVDAQTGEQLDPHIKADTTVTLGLPKKGMTETNSGNIWVADIGIPRKAYQQAGIETGNPFHQQSLIQYTDR
ncbi:MAG: NAD(P)H-hydrate epimerase, partial [Candidatus Nanohaloarchaea archaeon]|nr:NAD(P)H-hydrate epimerase [Candidatus Nanohaloarchaea archaeon]